MSIEYLDIDGRPQFVKHPIGDVQEGKDCGHRSGLCLRPMPRSLMELAGRRLITTAGFTPLSKQAEPTPVLPVLPSRHVCLSNRRKSFLSETLSSISLVCAD